MVLSKHIESKMISEELVESINNILNDLSIENTERFLLSELDINNSNNLTDQTSLAPTGDSIYPKFYSSFESLFLYLIQNYGSMEDEEKITMKLNSLDKVCKN